MMKTFIHGFCFLFCAFVIFACQKELSLEKQLPSIGSLKSETTGECLPKTLAGTYKVGAGLGDTNFIEVEVNVTQTGSYLIYTDTINGYSFKAEGNFSNSGSNTVKLAGSGTPLVAGFDDFTVFYDTSSCFVTIEATADLTTEPLNPAVFTLAGAPGACGNFQVAGSYAKGVALISANTASMNVNVTSPGSYTVTTNTVNGYTFSGSGTLASGTQTITLIGSGTPAVEGVNAFTVTAGTSTCTFNITVTTTAPPPVTGVHFPLTENSWWSYNDPTTAGDTVKRTHLGEASANGNTYRELEEVYEGGQSAFYYYRRAGDDYFEYTEVDNYSIMTFDDDILGEILFLKENLVTGQKWTSAEFSGTENGVAKKLKYEFTCTNASAGTVTVGNKPFTDVYYISFKSLVSTSGGAFTDEGVIWEALYAKNVGLISLKATVAASPAFVMEIRNYKVL
jgi:hypothetical protein